MSNKASTPANASPLTVKEAEQDVYKRQALNAAPTVTPYHKQEDAADET